MSCPGIQDKSRPEEEHVRRQSVSDTSLHPHLHLQLEDQLVEADIQGEAGDVDEGHMP